MATIDQLDISVHNLYAIRTQMIEQINQQLHLEEAASIPPQTHIENFYLPQISEIDMLLGIIPMHTPWAYFFPPQRFSTLRRSPFSFSRIAPSLKAIEEGGEEYENLLSIVCSNQDEEKEKAIIANCFKQMGKINNWLGFIIGRIGQFLQG